MCYKGKLGIGRKEMITISYKTIYISLVFFKNVEKENVQICKMNN